ncbi:DUF2750 domain-containing protein [Hymenobacter sp. BT175]|uniref:DUF2750 domain-containing protein n=1 Tax=Hymenobacter translucens TaxID=2886507 RepID=UPI001D0F2A7D|nr:DUF2750 domain-containing protein [Hymenobacter translucens]MCC2544988.1 DUF2750 domain-containing protein [Hymenobacter translucens]
MSNLTPTEKTSVLGLEPYSRYAYSISQFADSEVVYSLQRADGGLAVAELDNQPFLSIWPHPEFAQTTGEQQWPGYQVCNIPLADFTLSLLPSLDERILFNVFGIGDCTGFMVNQQELLRDIVAALNKY